MVVPVIDREEPLLQADIIMSSSMTLSLILRSQLQPLETVADIYILAAPALHNENILVADGCVWRVLAGAFNRVRLYERISTEVSPLANLRRATFEGFWPSRSQMLSTRRGCDEPEKMHVWVKYRQSSSELGV